jgi:hypothetical protein
MPQIVEPAILYQGPPTRHFESLADVLIRFPGTLAKDESRGRREEYNMFRPHSALGDLTPQQFAEQHAGGLKARKLYFWLDQFLGEAPVHGNEVRAFLIRRIRKE